MADAKIVITAEDRATGTLRGVGKEFDQFGGNVSRVLGPLASLQGALLAVAGSAVITGIRNVIAELDDLSEAAQGVGTTAVALAELRQAAQFSGVGAEKLDKALSGLSTRLADAARGGEESAGIFKALGVSVKDNDGTLRDSGKVLGDIADKFKGYRDGAEKTALANELFGEKLGRVLIPYLNQGSDSLRQFAGVSEKSVKDAEALQAQVDKLTSSWQRFRLQVAGAVAGLFNQDENSLEALQKALAGTEKQIDAVRRKLSTETEPVRIGQWQVALEGLEDQAARTTAAIAKLQSAATGGGDDKPPAPPLPDKKRATVRTAEGLTEAQRALAQYVNGLERALQATEDLSESEKTAAAIRQGAFGEVTPQVRAMLMRLSEEIDLRRALNKIKVDADQGDAKRAEDEMKRIAAAVDADRAMQGQLASLGQQRLDAVRQRLASEEELERDRYKRQQEDLQTALLAQRVTEDEFRVLSEQQETDHQKRITAIRKREEDARLQIAQAAFGTVAGLMNSNSRKVFEIGKAGAIAQATISTAAGIAKVWETWAAYPPIAAALSAATLANGITQIQRIKSTQFGGGGGGSVASGAVTTPGQGPFDTSGGSQSVATSQAAARRSNVSLTIVGEVFSAEQVRELIAKINEQSDLGAEIRVTRG